MRTSGFFCAFAVCFVVVKLPNVKTTEIKFNDPGFSTQWYLDYMRVKEAWELGYTGKGVVLSVVDEGLDQSHEEFKQRWDKKASYNFATGNPDPKPATSGNKHGQMVGGVAAGEAGNNKCGAGIAYQASVGGINFVVNGNTEGEGKRQNEALSYNKDHIDIYACAWGPDDAIGRTVGYNKAHTTMKEGVEKGRSGKGSIYVFASGNEGVWRDSCTYDGYASSPYTFAISALTPQGAPSAYSEFCPGISAVAFVRDSSAAITDNSFVMATASTDNQCENKFAASSAATAVASGIFALVLHANPNLSWRDLHHILARTGNSDAANDESLPQIHKWKTNAAGFRVSNAFGFGILDAYAMVILARNWTNVPQQKICFQEANEFIKITYSRPAELAFDCSACDVDSLEHVVLTMNLTFSPRKHLRAKIVAPSGTVSYMLLPGRTYDFSESDVIMYPVKTLHHWGENPAGRWRVIFESMTSEASGHVSYTRLYWYGTNDVILPTVSTKSTTTTSQPSSAAKSRNVKLVKLFCSVFSVILFAIFI